MGRNAKYRNAAEKQKAYRERKKALQWLQNDLEKRADALRKMPAGTEIAMQNHSDYAAVERDERFIYRVNSLLVEYLIQSGELVEVRRSWTKRYFVFQE